MARFLTTPRIRRAPRPAPVPPTRGEVVAQVLCGVVIGAAAVYAAVVVRRGPVVALVVLLVGAAYLLRNRRRVLWVARGVLASGLSALAATLVVLALGHDVL